MNKSNSFKALIYNFMGTIITYITSIIMVKLFSLEQYGYYNMFITYVVLISTFVQFGIPQLLTREVSINKLNINEIFNKGCKFILKLWILSSIIIILARTFFYNKLIINGEFSNITIVLMIIFILVETVKGLIKNIYISLSDYIYHSFFEFVIIRILLIISLVIVFSLGLSINYAISLYMILNILICIHLFNKIHIRQNIHISIKYILKVEKLSEKELTYSFFMMLHLLSNTLLFAIDKIIVNKYLSLEDVGVYSFLFSLSQLIGIFATCFTSLYTPEFAKYIADKDYMKVSKLYKESESTLNFLTLPILTTCIIYSTEIVSVFGDEFIVGSRVFLFLVFAQFFNGFFGFNGTIINMSKYYKVQLYMKILFISFIVVFDIYFISKFGLNGAAYASAISFMVYNLSKTIVVYKYDKISPFSKTTVKQIIIFVILFLGIKLILGNIIIMSPFYSIVFLVVITVIQYPFYIFAFEKELIKQFIIQYIKL